jgi:hypothetical protein
MKRVPYGVKKGMYLLLLKEGSIAIEEFYRKAYFVNGRHRKITLQAYIRNTKGIERDHNDIVRLNEGECPVWLQYALYIKRNGMVTTSEVARAFGHNQTKVHNEIERYVGLFNLGKDKNKNTYELKLGDIQNKEVDKL